MRNPPEAHSKRFRHWPLWIDVVLTLAIFFLAHSTPPPDVNESHYLTKAKHLWNPEYAPGDIFLSSGNAHWVFLATAGAMAQLFSLTSTAWIGRWIVWMLQASAWCWMVRRFANWPLAGPVSGLFFMAALDFGHLSGEWVIGGFEGKGIAYAAIFLAIGFAASERWTPTWVCLGVACAWHVLIGGWVAICFLLYSQVHRYSHGKRGCECIPSYLAIHLRGWLFALPFISCGLLPSLAMNLGVDASVSQEASFIYVYQRLPHHLSPLYFAGIRWGYHAAWLALAILIGIGYLYRGRLLEPSNQAPSLSIFWWLAIGSLILTLIGLSIDGLLAATKPNLAASWLRYYWFRWHDVAWPLAVAITLTHLAFDQSWKLKTPIAARIVQASLLGLLFLPGLLWFLPRVQRQWDDHIPQADRRALLLPHESAKKQERAYRDWIDVCQWIQKETPADSLWLTPQHQQTFKWYAQRAEFVNWKDVPQSANQLVDWRARFTRCYRKVEGGQPAYTTTETAMQLQREFGIQYMLIDLRDTQKLPPFPWLYPEVGRYGMPARQSTFAVLAIPTLTTDAKP